MHKGFAKLGIVLMVLTSAVAVMGMGFGLWTQVLTVGETINTGTVNLEYTLAFTDYDGVIDDPLFDSFDTSTTPVIYDA